MFSRKSCLCLLLAFLTTAALVAAVVCHLSRSRNTAEQVPPPHASGTRLHDAEAHADFQFEYQWNLRDCPSGTVILGGLEPQTIHEMKGDAIWTIALTARDGTLTINSDIPQPESANPFCKLHARFYIAEKPTVMVRMPSTRRHSLRRFTLFCSLEADYGFGIKRRTAYLQELAVDLTDGAADLQAPGIPASLKEQPHTYILRGAPTGLPERFCGTAAERELLRYLFELAKVENAATAAALLPQLRQRGQQLIDSFADASAPWPDCWGRGAGTARSLSRKVLPLLAHMQEHNCYDSAALAEFINVPIFCRIFGDAQEEAND